LIVRQGRARPDGLNFGEVPSYHDLSSSFTRDNFLKQSSIVISLVAGHFQSANLIELLFREI
jgi:hypothetical protein